MKAKVLIGTSSFGKRNPAPLELLRSKGLEIILNPYGRTLIREELIALLPGVDGLLAGLETVDRGVLATSHLKVISRCGSGCSNIDLQACEELGILFNSTPFGPTQAVAELTVAMIINLLRDVQHMVSSLDTGRWERRTGFQLKGKTVAIIGFGRIGRRTAYLLKPFEVDLIAVDPSIHPEKECIPVAKLHDAIQIADIIILQAGGQGEIIGKMEFGLMKNGAFICNVGRGRNLNEAELLKALVSGKVAAAWLDSFADEPYFGPLCGHPNVLLTPHAGSYTAEGRLDMELQAAQNLIDGLSTYNIP